MLKIKDLNVRFKVNNNYIYAVNGINLEIPKGETVSIIGESGSGKSVTAYSISGLLPIPPGEITAGKINFENTNLLNLNNKKLNKIRGNDISIIFQNIDEVLNPNIKIGYQIAEPLLIHKNIKKKEALEKSMDMLKKVDMPNPHEIINFYPHQLSGGMKQRVMIAIALINNPKLLIADEPTTALDVTVQAEILELLKRIKEEYSVSILFITHDLGVAYEISDKIAIMYAGEILEKGSTESITKNPMHPYTKDLIKCIPRINKTEKTLYSIKGSVSQITEPIIDCCFYDRCSYKMNICKEVKPKVKNINNHLIKCHLYGDNYER
ncbi:MAG: ABC transporter ATP-binding protein [Bacillota bacterium]|nr:ABC transporter ATP-binding protein [Bacillota bacterium]MDW7667322.1 ABC transporter ATP-binding protein [Bacillota bacterium]